MIVSRSAVGVQPSASRAARESATKRAGSPSRLALKRCGTGFPMRSKQLKTSPIDVPTPDQERDRMLELPLSLTRTCRRKEREAQNRPDRGHSPRLGRNLEHCNLHGEFDFSDERMVDTMGVAIPKNPAFE
jgi:hypothetical protein